MKTPSISRDYNILRKLRVNDFKAFEINFKNIRFDRDGKLEAQTYEAGYEDEGKQH